jgi:hypothetical protein
MNFNNEILEKTDKIKKLSEDLVEQISKLNVSIQLKKDFPEDDFPIKIGLITSYPHNLEHGRVTFTDKNNITKEIDFSTCNKIYQNVARRIYNNTERKIK